MSNDTVSDPVSGISGAMPVASIMLVTCERTGLASQLGTNSVPFDMSDDRAKDINITVRNCRRGAFVDAGTFVRFAISLAGTVDLIEGRHCCRDHRPPQPLFNSRARNRPVIFAFTGSYPKPRSEFTKGGSSSNRLWTDRETRVSFNSGLELLMS